MKIWQKNITVTSLIKDFDNQLFYNIHDWKIKAFSNNFLVNVEFQLNFKGSNTFFIFILLMIFIIVFLKFSAFAFHFQFFLKTKCNFHGIHGSHV